MRLPWWFLKPRDEEDEPRTLGTRPSDEEGAPEKRLMVTRRDEWGHPIERTWVDEGAETHYDERIWRDSAV